MQNIFLVKSPLQFLNAAEAISYFKLNKKDCFIILMGDSKTMPQLVSTASEFFSIATVVSLSDVSIWGGIDLQKKITCEKKINLKQFDIYRLNRLARLFRNPKRLFIGDYRMKLMLHFANIIAADENVLLDDGNGTLLISEARKRKKRFIPYLSLKKKLSYGLKRLLFNLREEPLDSVTFFSIYDLDVPEFDRHIKHDFDNVRALSGSVGQIDAVYFVGAPLVETGYLSRDDFEWHLKRICEFFSNDKIFYIPHRRESDDLFPVIEGLGMQIRRFAYPIEFEIAFKGPRPGKIASFFSSALPSCHEIFKDSIDVISFSINKTRCNNTSEMHMHNLDVAYGFFAKYKSDHFINVNL